VQLLGNILWFLLAGLPLFVGYLVAGLAMCVTIVGIPFGLQAFKLAVFSAWPFGQVVVELPHESGCLTVIGNVIWLLIAGIWLALWHLVAGVLLCLTLIGIPFGIASFRMAALALTPFGKTVLTEDEARRLQTPYTMVVGPFTPSAR
jgi:uncharacterized membrane protein YccF (DUF307 family)